MLLAAAISTSPYRLKRHYIDEACPYLRDNEDPPPRSAAQRLVTSSCSGHEEIGTIQVTTEASAAMSY